MSDLKSDVKTHSVLAACMGQCANRDCDRLPQLESPGKSESVTTLELLVLSPHWVATHYTISLTYGASEIADIVIISSSSKELLQWHVFFCEV